MAWAIQANNPERDELRAYDRDAEGRFRDSRGLCYRYVRLKTSPVLVPCP